MARVKFWRVHVKINKILTSKIILVGLCLLSTASFANPFQQLRARLDSLGSMRASFIQKVTDSHGRLLQSSVGSMALARPGKFRWEISKPMHQIIIADGENMWIYDVDLKQVTVKRLRQGMENPALFLTGYTKDLGRYFNIAQDAESFQLIPKRQGSDFREIIFKFESNQLLQMKFTDHLGQRSVLNFQKVEVNQTLPRSLFIMKVPNGVDVIRESVS